jgi:hypothetical protein
MTFETDSQNTVTPSWQSEWCQVLRSVSKNIEHLHERIGVEEGNV